MVNIRIKFFVVTVPNQNKSELEKFRMIGNIDNILSMTKNCRLHSISPNFEATFCELPILSNPNIRKNIISW